MHAAAHTTPSAGSHPQRSAQALALQGCSHMSCVKSPNQCRDQHITPSSAQHALGLTSRLSPLLQATSPAISSPLLADSAAAELLLDTPAAPRSPKLAATPASYARSTLSGLTVSRSTATAAIIMP